jgi:two-component system, OmpR family, sensor kinase
VTVALVAAGTATYTALQGFLTTQLNDSLQSAIHSAYQTWHDCNEGRCGGPGPGTGYPGGSYMTLLTPGGQQVGASVQVPQPNGSTGSAVIPKSLPAATEESPAFLSVGGRGAVAHYQLIEAPLDEAGGNIFVLAEPLTAIDATLGRLLLLEALVGVVALVAAGNLAWWLVRVSLRPLERIEDTAAAIAAGDLGRRVEPAAPNTEVGRLGLALNAMLTQIERAFSERTRSEQKLREFMAAASHELRTPLTSIRGYAEMLRRGAESSQEDAAQARRRIEEESVRMTGLVDDMLLLARLDQGRPLERQRVDLARLASDACADARASSRDRTIALEAPKQLWVVGDEARLRQAIGNLVRNAVVHTPPSAPIEVAVRTADAKVVVEVADHGPGLPAGERSRVFEPFYRSDAGRSRDRGGAGLGLSIVAAVATAHAGEVDVAETPGGGATFRLSLPLSDDAGAPAGVEMQQQHEELPAAG